LNARFGGVHLQASARFGILDPRSQRLQIAGVIQDPIQVIAPLIWFDIFQLWMVGPNPGADGRPGALWFAGFGPGRENTRSLVPGWYGGIGPRIGLAYTPDNKTTFRTAFGRSFARVTAVQGSGHFAGFIGQYVFDNSTQGVQPTFKLDGGLPAYKLPPSIDPAFSNGNSVDYWQGQEATRAPENLFWTFTMQRQVASNMVLEAGYNANIGTHLQTGLLNLDQVPTAIFNQLVSQLGPTAALNLLRGDINAPAAKSAGINALTAKVYCPISRQPELKHAAVKIAKAELGLDHHRCSNTHGRE
jgi:hypothetical protein